MQIFLKLKNLDKVHIFLCSSDKYELIAIEVQILLIQSRFSVKPGVFVIGLLHSLIDGDT